MQDEYRARYRLSPLRRQRERSAPAARSASRERRRSHSRQRRRSRSRERRRSRSRERRRSRSRDRSRRDKDKVRWMGASEAWLGGADGRVHDRAADAGCHSNVCCTSCPHRQPSLTTCRLRPAPPRRAPSPAVASASAAASAPSASAAPGPRRRRAAAAGGAGRAAARPRAGAATMACRLKTAGSPSTSKQRWLRRPPSRPPRQSSSPAQIPSLVTPG